ncbi:hypothetical protein SB748_30475, partial [Rhizobium sp. SIMBA_035]
RDQLYQLLFFGQIDKWITYTSEEKRNNKVMNTNNRKTIEIGNTIKISESVFTTWLKLLTWVDRTAAKKEEGHIKSSASYIAKEILGYTATRGM